MFLSTDTQILILITTPYSIAFFSGILQDVMDTCNLKSALQQVKSILNTPIKVFEMEKDAATDSQEKSQNSQNEDVIAEGDLPGQITRLLGKGETTIL